MESLINITAIYRFNRCVIYVTRDHIKRQPRKYSPLPLKPRVGQVYESRILSITVINYNIYICIKFGRTHGFADRYNDGDVRTRCELFPGPVAMRCQNLAVKGGPRDHERGTRPRVPNIKLVLSNPHFCWQGWEEKKRLTSNPVVNRLRTTIKGEWFFFLSREINFSWNATERRPKRVGAPGSPRGRPSRAFSTTGRPSSSDAEHFPHRPTIVFCFALLLNEI